MNYEHAYHAGNHADLLKHLALAAAVERLAAKPKPLTAIDFFAGSGIYDLLLDDRAQRGGEWRAAAAPFWDAGPEAAPAAARPFWSLLTALNGGPELRYYPGSPRILQHLLREGDKLLCVDAKPSEAEALRAALGRDSRLKIQEADGWAALESFLPPTPRRGLALLDPPFEKAGDFTRLARAAARARALWSTGVLMLWWPETAQTPTDFGAEIRRAVGDAPLLVARLRVEAAPTGLKSSALALVNPPFQLDADLQAIGPWLAALLGGAYAQAWLTPPV